MGGSWSTATGCLATKKDGGNAIPIDAANCGAYINDETFDNDSYAEVDIVSLTDFPGVLLRHNTDYYTVYAHSGGASVRCAHYDGGSFTAITPNITTTVQAGDTLRAEISGQTITVKINDVEVGTFAASTYSTSGPNGIYQYGIETTTGSITAWRGGNLAAAAGNPWNYYAQQ